MITVKSQLVQQMWAAITLVLVLGALSMIWPSIIAVSLGVLLLLQSFSDGQDIAVLSWKGVGNLSIVFDSIWRSGLPGILL